MSWATQTILILLSVHTLYTFVALEKSNTLCPRDDGDAINIAIRKVDLSRIGHRRHPENPGPQVVLVTFEQLFCQSTRSVQTTTEIFSY